MLESSHATSPFEANLKLEKNEDEDKVNTTLFKQIIYFLRYSEANLKLEKNEDEDKVNTTMFKKIVGSLRYLCNRDLS